MNELIVLLVILFLTVIGYLLIRGFNLLTNKNKLFVISCSYGLGVGVIAMQLFIYSGLSIPWKIETLMSPWVIFIIWILFKKRSMVKLSMPQIAKLKLFDKLLLLGILLALSYVIFEALIRPVTVWDAWAIWLLKSKIFFIDGKINPEMLNYVRSDYPLVVSLLGTFVYIVLGHVNDTAVLLMSVAFYFFLGLAFFAALKKEYGVTYALLFTFIYVTMQNFIRHGGRMEAGQADLPVAYYSFISLLLLFEYIKKGNWKVLLLLNIFLAIGSLVKFEGIPMAIVICSLIINYILKKKVYRHLLFLLFWIVPLIDWQIYKKINHINYDYFMAHPLVFSSSKIANSIWGTIKELFNLRSWGMLWISYWYAIMFLGVKNNRLIIINLILLTQIILYVLLYMFMVGNDPQSSGERLLLHVAPLAIYYIAILIERKFPFFYKILTK